MKRIAMAIAVLLILLCMPASLSIAQDKKVDLTIVVHPTWGPTAQPLTWTGQPSVLWRKILPKISEKFPNVRVKTDEILGDVESREKYLLMARQGTAPDVLGIDSYWAGSFASIGALVPLDDLIPKQVQDDVLPAFKLKYGGKTICIIPSTDMNSMLWYRTDKFAAAGLSTPPKDWNELKLYAKKLTTSDVYGLVAPAGRNEHTTVVHLGMYWQGADQFLDKNGMPAFNNQASADVFDFFADLYKQKLMPPDIINGNYDSTEQTFYKEKAAMMFQGSWQTKRYIGAAPNLKGKIDVAANPVSPRTKRHGQNSGGWALAITTKDPAKHEAAAYFLSLMYGLDKDLYKEHVLEVGNLPTTATAIKDPAFRSTKWDQIIMDNLKYSNIRPSTFALYPDASLEWAQALQETILGKDAKVALKEATDRTIQIGKDKGIISD